MEYFFYYIHKKNSRIYQESQHHHLHVIVFNNCRQYHHSTMARVKNRIYNCNTKPYVLTEMGFVNALKNLAVDNAKRNAYYRLNRNSSLFW